MTITHPFTLLLSVLLISGCSAMSRYVISNNSGEIAVINSSYPSYSNSSKGRGRCPIRKLGALPETTLAKSFNEDTPWQKLSADKYVFDDKGCSIKIAIIAGASVTFAKRDPFNVPARTLPPAAAELIRLDIHGEKTETRLVGAEVFRRFERKEEKLYVYDFP